MGIEVLLCLCLLSTGLLAGYVLANQRVTARKELEFQEKADLLNKNLANFSRAYDDFVMKGVDTETRITSLEFRINGVTNKK